MRREESAPDGFWLEDVERQGLTKDLGDVRLLRETLGPKGIKGATFVCDECHDAHYFTWAMLEATLESMLIGESPPPHEPAASPDDASYVTWEYAQGYLDGSQTTVGESELTMRLILEVHDDARRDVTVSEKTVALTRPSRPSKA